MHLFAIDDKGNFLSAYQAEKKIDYRCPECKEIVRCRGGFLRQTHFYHLKPNHHCRQSGKTLIHLQTQLYLKKTIADCCLENPFPRINRIADVVWEKEKLIFEIQCSPISAKEVEERNRDYQSIGYQVIWILHDRLYNKQRLTAAEYFLKEFPHYFTNINAEGTGFIYDQWDIVEKGRRLKTMEPRQVSLSSFQSCDPNLFSKKDCPKWLLKRVQSWPLFFSGDYLEQFLNLEVAEKVEFLKEASTQEQAVLSSGAKQTQSGVLKKLRQAASLVTFPYRLTFHLILEKFSR